MWALVRRGTGLDLTGGVFADFGGIIISSVVVGVLGRGRLRAISKAAQHAIEAEGLHRGVKGDIFLLEDGLRLLLVLLRGARLRGTRLGLRDGAAFAVDVASGLALVLSGRTLRQEGQKRRVVLIDDLPFHGRKARAALVVHDEVERRWHKVDGVENLILDRPRRAHGGQGRMEGVCWS